MATKRAKLADGVALLVLVLTTTTVVGGTVLYVDLRAPLDTTDHRHWETAYPCLQNAIQDARAGDEIRVAQGTYMPDRIMSPAGRSGVVTGISATGLRQSSFILRDGVVMKGGYAGLGAPDPNARDINAYPSILSGDLRGNDVDLTDLQWQTLADFTGSSSLDDNSYTVITLLGTSEETVVDGFTITAGYEPYGHTAREDNGFIVPQPSGRSDTAGGMWISGGCPIVTRCSFYRNIARSQRSDACGGPAVLCSGSQATLRDCSFIENIAFGDETISTGGAVLNVESDPNIVNCTFTNNVATGQDAQYAGGAMASFYSNPKLMGCSFVENSVVGSDSDVGLIIAGGALFNHGDSSPVLTDCTFTANSAETGGAIYSQESCNPALTRCTFEGNAAANVGGAVATGADCNTAAVNCRFLGNSASSGGAWSETSNATIVNCLFSGNMALSGGAISSSILDNLSVINCTFASDHASEYAATYEGSEVSTAEFTNCILWDDNPLQELQPARGELSIRYCDVKGGWAGPYNINEDPRFQDPLGPDGIVGTLDDDLRLILGSPCLDVGDDAALPPETLVDLDGQQRIANHGVDMGAYEFNSPLNYYVDSVSGSDSNNGWAPHTAFATIQKGIDTACDGYQVVVLPGVYTEEINFSGKAVTVIGSGGAPLLQAPDSYAVSCYMAETPASILQNFVIRHSDVGIFLAGASPTIRNVTLSGNQFGIAAYAGSNPDISNCILWGNAAGDLFDCTARFSCIQQGTQGEGNISEDPLFGDPVNGDYHLYSEGGRYVPLHGLWSFDTVTSPCVDAGDPTLDPGAERIPNGGRINMGAFGGTHEASLSLCVPCVVGP